MSDPTVPAIDLIAHEPDLLAPALEHARTSAAAISEVTPEQAEAIAELVFDGFRRGRDARKMAAELDALLGRADRENSLKLVNAQLAKVMGKVDELRQRRAGITAYRWDSSGDSPGHTARKGQTFSWDSPPPGGHPGQEDGCRCHAEPVTGFDDLFNDGED